LPIAFFQLRRYPADADDIAFLLCAINGNATHLVSFDSGFTVIVPGCSFAICQPLAFLAALRAVLTPRHGDKTADCRSILKRAPTRKTLAARRKGPKRKPLLDHRLE
jgi:hypothetical protein